MLDEVVCSSWTHLNLTQHYPMTPNTVNSPVVPAGTIDLKWETMSILFSFLALIARQRINCLVSAVGSTSAADFNCRFFTLSSIWATTSSASHDWDRIDFRTPSGRTSDCSLVWKKEQRGLKAGILRPCPHESGHFWNSIFFIWIRVNGALNRLRRAVSKNTVSLTGFTGFVWTEGRFV